MSEELVRVVVPSGVSVAAPFSQLTERSLFVAATSELQLGSAVRIELFGESVEAWVAYLSELPPGAVLTFEASPSLAARIRGILGPDPWGDEVVTGTHDAAAELMAAGASPSVFASEEPTNPALAALDPASAEAPVYVDEQLVDGARAGLGQPAAPPESEQPGSKRLRATTQVNNPTLSDPSD